MAPEQVEGEEADARSDIFAPGAVLYEMATGKRGFEGKAVASSPGGALRPKSARCARQDLVMLLCITSARSPGATTDAFLDCVSWSYNVCPRLAIIGRDLEEQRAAALATCLPFYRFGRRKLGDTLGCLHTRRRSDLNPVTRKRW